MFSEDKVYSVTACQTSSLCEEREQHSSLMNLETALCISLKLYQWCTALLK